MLIHKETGTIIEKERLRDIYEGKCGFITPKPLYALSPDDFFNAGPSYHSYDFKEILFGDDFELYNDFFTYEDLIKIAECIEYTSERNPDILDRLKVSQILKKIKKEIIKRNIFNLE